MTSLFPITDLKNPYNREKNQDNIRSLCHNAFLGNQQSLCRVLGRFHMFVDTSDVGFASHMLMNGFWEMDITEAMSSLLKRGMTVVDCGANFGYYSLLMAYIIGPQGHIYIIEPNPKTFNLLSKTFRINGFRDRYTLIEAALSDSNNQQVAFRVPRNEPKNARLLRKGEVADAIDTDLFEITSVTTKTLDNVIGAEERVDFVKIDVEGAEQKLWKGMQNILERNEDIIIFMEVNSGRYPDPEGFYKSIIDNGFILRVIDAKEGILDTELDKLLKKKGDSMLCLSRNKIRI